MISSVDMKEVKRKVNSAYFADGLWDILLGLFLMLFIVYIGDWPIFIPPFVTSLTCCVVGYFVVKKIRQYTTYPRVGYSKTTGSRRIPMIILICFALTLVFVGFSILFIFATKSYAHDSWLFSLFGYMRQVAFAAVVAFVAYRYGVKRWYLYALWMFLWPFSSIVFARLLGAADYDRWNMSYHWFIMGGVILLSGIIVFARFLRNNPKMVEGELDEQTQNG